MDAGTVLYLFVARQCHPHYLQALFGKEKLLKTDQVSEETVAGVGSEFSGQVMELVRVLREYMWTKAGGRRTSGCRCTWCGAERTASTRRTSTCTSTRRSTTSSKPTSSASKSSWPCSTSTTDLCVYSLIVSIPHPAIL